MYIICNQKVFNFSVSSVFYCEMQSAWHISLIISNNYSDFRLGIDSKVVSVIFFKICAFFACKEGAVMVYKRYNNCFEGVAPQRSKYKI